MAGVARPKHQIPEDRRFGQLARLSEQIREHQDASRALEDQRRDLIRSLLAEGCTHSQIVQATGLTRARIAQLAAKPIDVPPVENAKPLSVPAGRGRPSATVKANVQPIPKSGRRRPV